MQKIMMSEAQAVIGGTATTIEEEINYITIGGVCLEQRTLIEYDKNGNMSGIRGNFYKQVAPSLCGGGSQ